MKGIILAGGSGTRLNPATISISKQIIPIYDKPMIYYPIQTLVKAGVRDVMLVTGGNSSGDFLRLLGNGKAVGLDHIHYAYQEGEGGIAAALSLAEHFADGDPIVVVLGDNIIEDDIGPFVKRFLKQGGGARILLKKVPDPERFGVVSFKGKKITGIEEKPKKPKGDYAVTGFYMYDGEVFDIVRTLKPSKRNELEITDVNNHYLHRGKLGYDILKGYWTDAGTFESLYHASTLIARKKQRLAH